MYDMNRAFEALKLTKRVQPMYMYNLIVLTLRSDRFSIRVSFRRRHAAKFMCLNKSLENRLYNR